MHLGAFSLDLLSFPSVFQILWTTSLLSLLCSLEKSAVPRMVASMKMNAFSPKTKRPTCLAP